ncbi:hypothetical protein ABFA07_019525 [Porites harrisoni]
MFFTVVLSLVSLLGYLQYWRKNFSKSSQSLPMRENTTLLEENKMAEDKAKSSVDEAGGNDSKVFGLFL